MKKTIAFLLLLQTAFLLSCTTDADDEWDASKVCPVSKRGTFVDARDGRVYKYTTIGDQVWMAENLNYDVERLSSCLYEEDNCARRGRHYEYASVMNGGLCPSGWHVPTLDEWKVLIDNVDGEKEGAVHLKSTVEWLPLNPGEESNGLDECGFAALPVPRKAGTHYGYDANFMTSTDKCDSDGCDNYSRYFYFARMESNSRSITIGFIVAQGSERLTIRCVKD